jgi:hypothetical protein
MGQREEVLTLAYCVLDVHPEDPAGYVARKIELAEAQHDGVAAAKWRKVARAMKPYLEPSTKRAGAARRGPARSPGGGHGAA